MKKSIAVGIACALMGGAACLVAAREDFPQLRDGDLVFQTSEGSQSDAVLAATGSPFTHMGIVKNDNGRVVIVEAIGNVTETPLNAWVERGASGRIAIYRHPKVTPDLAKRVLAAAKTFYGRPYDIFFSFRNKAIYCSELPYIAYRAVGISIGRVQKISELKIGNSPVKALIESRWRQHEECKSRRYDFGACYRHILNQDLISPASIAADPALARIYTNY